MPAHQKSELAKGLVRSVEMLQELRNDIDHAYSALEIDRDSQYLRRCVVRAVFSFIEAAIESVKVEVRSTIRCGHFTDPLSESELETLGGIGVVLQHGGKYLPLDQNLKRTFRLAAKAWRLSSFRLHTDNTDYQDLLRAKSARNRLTHPKTFYDIEVSDSDMHSHTVAGMWVQTELRRLFAERIKGLSEELPEKDREIFMRGIARGDAFLP